MLLYVMPLLHSTLGSFWHSQPVFLSTRPAPLKPQETGDPLRLRLVGTPLPLLSLCATIAFVIQMKDKGREQRSQKQSCFHYKISRMRFCSGRGTKICWCLRARKFKIFTSELELWKPSCRTRSLLQNLHFRAWALETLFQEQVFTTKSSFQSLGSGSPLAGPGLYYKIFISELGLWRSFFCEGSVDF